MRCRQSCLAFRWPGRARSTRCSCEAARCSNAEPGRQQPPPTEERRDLAADCNAAAGVNRGNLVWLGWNPTPDK
eukprot:11199703-Lingulodinium_polyedra.AAC.1